MQWPQFEEYPNNFDLKSAESQLNALSTRSNPISGPVAGTFKHVAHGQGALAGAEQPPGAVPSIATQQEPEDEFADSADEAATAPHLGVSRSTQGAKKVRALYPYTGRDNEELSFAAGDIITELVPVDAQGWCHGELNGRQGLYPGSYVEPM